MEIDPISHHLAFPAILIAPLLYINWRKDLSNIHFFFIGNHMPKKFVPSICLSKMTFMPSEHTIYLLSISHQNIRLLLWFYFLLKNVPLDQLLHHFLGQVISRQIATVYQSVLHGVDAFLCHHLLKEYVIFLLNFEKIHKRGNNEFGINFNLWQYTMDLNECRLQNPVEHG